MNALNCTSFFQRTGWHCQQLPVPGGSALYVATPFTLRGGKPLDFYLTTNAEHVEFNDDGNTLFALSAIGYNLEDRRRWVSLENLACKLGFELTPTGAFQGIFPLNELQQRSEYIIRLFAGLIEWEEEHYQAKDTDLSLDGRYR